MGLAYISSRVTSITDMLVLPDRLKHAFTRKQGRMADRIGAARVLKDW